MAELLQWLVGDRGGQAFALPLTQVIRVTASPRICEVPLIPAGYVGVIEFEGEAIPVWDPFPESADAMWGATVIVADAPSGRVGFLSDVPPRVQSAATAAEAAHPAGAMWTGGIRLGGDDVPILDPAHFG